MRFGEALYVYTFGVRGGAGRPIMVGFDWAVAPRVNSLEWMR